MMSISPDRREFLKSASAGAVATTATVGVAHQVAKDALPFPGPPRNSTTARPSGSGPAVPM